MRIKRPLTNIKQNVMYVKRQTPDVHIIKYVYDDIWLLAASPTPPPSMCHTVGALHIDDNICDGNAYVGSMNDTGGK